jgi:hypothetical protein
VKLPVEMVAGSMASLKVAVTGSVTGTSTAPAEGDVAITEGAALTVVDVKVERITKKKIVAADFMRYINPP